MAIVTLRYWAAAKDAAGVAERKSRQRRWLTLSPPRCWPGGRPRSSGRDQAGRPGNPVRLRTVMARSSFLIDGQPPANGRMSRSRWQMTR